MGVSWWKIELGETPKEYLEREIKEEFNVSISVGKFFEESVYEYNKETIKLKTYLAKWIGGSFELKIHSEYRWIAPNELNGYDFVPADIPFIEKIKEDNYEF